MAESGGGRRDGAAAGGATEKGGARQTVQISERLESRLRGRNLM